MREKQKKIITLFVVLIVGTLSFSLTLLAMRAERKEVKSQHIKIEKELLSVKLEEVELTSVLKEISRQTGIKISIDESVKENITMEFIDIPLEVGLEKLLKGKRWVMVFDRITPLGLPEKYKLKEIDIFPQEELPFKLSKTDISDWKTYRNEEYGFEIKYPNSVKYDERKVSFPLAEAASGTVFVDRKLSVPLSGTYGGRYPFEEHPKAAVSSNRIVSQKLILNDIVSKNDITFKRDYWVVYGGMGNWDIVINYYTKRKNNYYMISLEHTFSGYVPGMLTAGGKKITKEEIINEILNKMPDNDYVRIFNQMFFTFRFLD